MAAITQLEVRPNLLQKNYFLVSNAWLLNLQLIYSEYTWANLTIRLNLKNSRPNCSFN